MNTSSIESFRIGIIHGERLLKIRISTLAKELTIENKVLIGYCQKLGMNVKDSALASISEEDRDRLLAFIKEGAASGEAAARGESLAPSREPAKPAAGKMPTIRTTAPKPPLAREVRRGSGAADEPASEKPVAPGATEVPVGEPSTHVMRPAAAAGKTPVAEAATKGSAPIARPGGGAPLERSSSAPLRREDYLPASGTVRTMAPRGNMTQIAPGALRRAKSRPTPQLPKL